MKPPKSDDRKSAETARDPDFVGAEAAMHRAARRAHRRAAENGGTVAIFENGRIVRIKPDCEPSS